jgi:hypothetical protein
MVPTQNELTPSLPPSTFRNAANANHVPTVSEWNAFPNETPTIFSIQDECPVLASLQKPKKLTIVDSDGAEKSFLCKPKDDLRKDLGRSITFEVGGGPGRHPLHHLGNTFLKHAFWSPLFQISSDLSFHWCPLGGGSLRLFSGSIFC